VGVWECGSVGVWECGSVGVRWAEEEEPRRRRPVFIKRRRPNFKCGLGARQPTILFFFLFQRFLPPGVLGAAALSTRLITTVFDMRQGSQCRYVLPDTAITTVR